MNFIRLIIVFYLFGRFLNEILVRCCSFNSLFFSFLAFHQSFFASEFFETESHMMLYELLTNQWLNRFQGRVHLILRMVYSVKNFRSDIFWILDGTIRTVQKKRCCCFCFFVIGKLIPAMYSSCVRVIVGLCLALTAHYIYRHRYAFSVCPRCLDGMVSRLDSLLFGRWHENIRRKVVWLSVECGFRWKFHIIFMLCCVWPGEDTQRDE